jgi:hypothetical protein
MKLAIIIYYYRRFFYIKRERFCFEALSLLVWILLFSRHLWKKHPTIYEQINQTVCCFPSMKIMVCHVGQFHRHFLTYEVRPVFVLTFGIIPSTIFSFRLAVECSRHYHALYLPKIHFNNIILSISTSRKWSLLMSFSSIFAYFPRICYMTYQSHPYWFNQPVHR